MPCHCSYICCPQSKFTWAPYKYTREALLQFPILADESPKWNILVAISTCDLKYTLSGPHACVYISGKSLVPMLQLLLSILYLQV